MHELAWAHLPGSLYPERQALRETPFDEWVSSRLGRLIRGLRGNRRFLAQVAEAAECHAEQVTRLNDADLCTQIRGLAIEAWERERSLALVLAMMREAVVRSLGLRPFGTQLMGAACLLSGQLAEMQTGEGKTLTAGLAAALAACAGVPVHVVTVNDYLAERDAQELKPLFDFLGLSVGVVVTGLELEQRRVSYGCDIAYCTGKELVFDYLKDRAATSSNVNQAQLRLRRTFGSGAHQTLLRGLYFAIVDEADSVLIDEARTPLILSENAGPPRDISLFGEALAMVGHLQADVHYAHNPRQRELHLLPAGRQWLAENCLAMGREWAIRRAREHWAIQALRARHLFRRNEHYIVKDDKVLIVDENTGRVLPGRTWEQGLHQMIEVKEACQPSDMARTVARITYQRFFRRYLRLSGMTGTAREVRAELWSVYRLSTVAVPTHRPCVRAIYPARYTICQVEKWQLIAQRVKELSLMGRSVLIGTRSVEASECLSRVLEQANLSHQVLNARQDSHEADLIKLAGTAGTITVATNMAGRGTDIKLSPAVKQAGGLHVILSEYHESRRIDRQLFGRAARQGDPGSAEAIVSLEDSIFVQYSSRLMKYICRWMMLLPKGSSFFNALLRQQSQQRAERLNARFRHETTKEDRRLESILSFSGRQ